MLSIGISSSVRCLLHCRILVRSSMERANELNVFSLDIIIFNSIKCSGEVPVFTENFIILYVVMCLHGTGDGL